LLTEICYDQTGKIAILHFLAGWDARARQDFCRYRAHPQVLITQEFGVSFLDSRGYVLIIDLIEWLS